MKDNCFIRGNVPMTKEEIRTLSLAKLQLREAENFLDIGTGTGSMAIEAAYMYPNLMVTTIDSNQEALNVLEKNQTKFQLTNIKSILGKAPIILSDSFDAIFVGGSGGNLSEILEWSFQLLKPGGCLVLNFILLENAIEAIEWLKTECYSFQAIQLQVGHYTKLGQGHYFKPQNPVMIIEMRKEE
ncbi:decarboxylating cobalt-precorrin-6B (C(15))-methyltransferase [Candidatus Enterococcus murrayae]|uniref:Decarboxylating cobalt-precorrin-6B (C(15))-methyltransferase n=1 Tax=Candidatus Enterococcus murrayae TaxID=2815321 RepID=A0ABS3HFA7_9ENTE|nr:decarboxylating cobalt-precorrin-6B (C(15))-methyltransferase [Enterococcus sp. MJM16]MBO0452139.1 decarboxylating cobalt-precorrin-6B (C(15))-methyltransferase [Enterococcus sp. MJM16]